MSSQRESITVLEECVDLQKRKSQDYQNPDSNIKQAMHYRRGVSTIHDMVQQKMYRAQSLLEPIENGSLREPNFESLEDTYKDAINYLSFAVSYIRGKMEGQDPTRDMLNRAKPNGGLSQSEVFTKPDPHSAMELLTEINTPLKEPRVVKAPSTLFPDETEIRLDGHDIDTPVEEKIKAAYLTGVAPVGEVRMPREGVNCTDAVQHTYIEGVAKGKVKDVLDRVDDDIKDHIERLEDRTK